MITRVIFAEGEGPALYGIRHATDESLRGIVTFIREEQRRRRLAKYVEASAGPALAAMSNAMLGITHAMACRAHLRAWAGHRPFWAPNARSSERDQDNRSGSIPAHGRMWTAAEGASADSRTRWVTEPVHDGGLVRRHTLSPLSAPAKIVRDYLRDKGYSWPLS